jgi:hypothetical protein
MLQGTRVIGAITSSPNTGNLDQNNFVTLQLSSQTRLIFLVSDIHLVLRVL